jgi:hypothetical protein
MEGIDKEFTIYIWCVGFDMRNYVMSHYDRWRSFIINLKHNSHPIHTLPLVRDCW